MAYPSENRRRHIVVLKESVIPLVILFFVSLSVAQTIDFRGALSNDSPVLGDEVVLTVEIGSADDLFSASFDIDYSPNRFTFVSCTEGNALNDDGATTVFLTSVDAVNGKIIVGISRLSPSPAVAYSGYRTCATLRFEASYEGNYSIAASNVGFFDDDANQLTLSVTDLPLTGVIGTGNYSPVISPDCPGELSVNEDEISQVDLSDYFSDVEDDAAGIPLTAEVDQSTVNTAIFSSISFSSHTLEIVPLSDQYGTDSITVSITDSNGDRANRQIIIIVHSDNDIPVITGQTSLSTPEETSLIIALSHFTVTDIDNIYPDDFTLSVLEGENYSVSGTEITPDADFNGELSVPVSVNDGEDESESFTCNITVTAVNDPPVITGQETIAVNEDESYTITPEDVQVTDPDNIWPDDFTLISGEGENYTLEGNNVRPDENFHGELTVPVKISDGTDESETFQLIINVGEVNDPPEITDWTPSADTLRIKIGETVSFEATVNDPDDEPVPVWTLDTDTVDPVIEFTSIGTYSVTVTADDGTSSVHHSWVVIVQPFPLDASVKVPLNDDCRALIEYTNGTRFTFYREVEDCDGDTIAVTYDGETTSSLLPGAEGIFFSLDGNFDEPLNAQLKVENQDITEDMVMAYHDGEEWNILEPVETSESATCVAELSKYGQFAVAERSAFETAVSKYGNMKLPKTFSMKLKGNRLIQLNVPKIQVDNLSGVIHVTDMKGRCIETISLPEILPGVHTLRLSGGKANAVYIVRFSSALFNQILTYRHLQ